MSIEQFYTTQSSTMAGKSGNARSASGSDGKGAATVAQGSAAGFFDLFLQNALAALEAQKAKASAAQTSGTAATNATSEEQSTDMMDILAEALNAIEPGSNDNAAELALGTENPEDELTIVKDILKDAFLISDEKSMRPALNNLQRALQKLEALALEDGEALIVANITPEQITELKSIVDNILSGADSIETTEENAEKFVGIVAGLISILPPKTKEDFLSNSKTLLLESGKSENQSLIGLKDIQARLNALEGNTVKKGTALDAPAQTQSSGSDATDSADFDETFKQILQNAKSVEGSEKATLAESMAAAKTGAATPDAATKAAAMAGVLKDISFGVNGTIASPAEFSHSALHEMGLPLGQSSIQSVNGMTSLVTQSHAATLPHPATQMVAASMKKLAGSGETTEIRLKLDPPELGRVEIKMSFGKDSAVKAVLIAEKPETFMMLQRDAQILERALQDAGLEADGNSLSFELAQDGQDFSQDGRHDGDRNKTGLNGNESDAEETVIETTMNWHVDPSSGHMRYNILA